MNLVDLINDIATSSKFERGYHRVFICPSCMNEILDDEDQATSVDLGVLRILDEKFHTCELAEQIDGHVTE